MCPLHACAIAAGDAARNVSTMPRLRLAPGSLARQLGGRHDGGGGGGRARALPERCRAARPRPVSGRHVSVLHGLVPFCDGVLQCCAASSRFGTAYFSVAWPRPVSGRHVSVLHGLVPFWDGMLQGCMAPSRFGTACRPSVQARLRSPCTNCPHQVRDDGANAPFVLSSQPLPRLPSRETLCTTSLQCAICIIIAVAPQGNKKRGALVCRSPSWVCPFVRG